MCIHKVLSKLVPQSSNWQLKAVLGANHLLIPLCFLALFGILFV